MSSDDINIDDAEEVLKQVFEKEETITKLLLQEHVPIKESLLYEHFKPKCQALITEPSVTGHKPATNTGEIDLDRFELIFKKLDKIDTSLSLPKRPMPKQLKVSQKMFRMNSTISLDRTEMPPNVTSSNCYINATFCEPKPIVSIETENVPHVTEELLTEFNSMKISSLQELRSNRIGSKTREILSRFIENINNLNVFCEKMNKTTKTLNTANPVEHELPSLNEELLRLLKSLADAVRSMRFMDDNRNMYKIESNEVPTTDELTKILHKFSCGMKSN